VPVSRLIPVLVLPLVLIPITAASPAQARPPAVENLKVATALPKVPDAKVGVGQQAKPATVFDNLASLPEIGGTEKLGPDCRQSGTGALSKRYGGDDGW